MARGLTPDGHKRSAAVPLSVRQECGRCIPLPSVAGGQTGRYLIGLDFIGL